jgi:hypothetical protein
MARDRCRLTRVRSEILSRGRGAGTRRTGTTEGFSKGMLNVSEYVVVITMCPSIICIPIQCIGKNKRDIFSRYTMSFTYLNKYPSTSIVDEHTPPHEYDFHWAFGDIQALRSETIELRPLVVCSVLVC